MNIEKRIRTIAAKKTKVRITKRTRSSRGFLVIHPGGNTTHKTKREALNNLLARLRCSNETLYAIDTL